MRCDKKFSIIMNLYIRRAKVLVSKFFSLVEKIVPFLQMLLKQASLMSVVGKRLKRAWACKKEKGAYIPKDLKILFCSP